MMPRPAIALVLCLAAPAPARAADVSVGADCFQDGSCLETAEFLAAPGERNRVVLHHDGDDVVTIADAGAPLTVGDGCVALSGHQARCTTDADGLDGLEVRLRLGDGDDTAHVDSGSVYGGPGEDRLSTVDGFLVGGPGRDHLTATGPASFRDDDGARSARDVYSGAHAAVSYAGRRRGVRIDLRAGRADEDVLRRIESATGTSHADTIIGTAGRNRLDGGGGRDRIAGLGGDDSIRLDRGTVDAGAGNDSVDLFSGDARAQCGPGRDLVSAGDGALLEGCEGLRLFDSLDEHVRVHPRTTGVVLSGLGCSDCTFALYEALAGRVLVARARLGATALRLNGRGRRLLAARGRLVLTVRTREVFFGGHHASDVRTVITRPRP